MDQVKAFLFFFITAISNFFLPIKDFIGAILILLFVNFLSGWIEDSIHSKGWQWHKAFKTFIECCVLLGIGTFVFAIGHFMHMEDEAVISLSYIYMAAIWFFMINILRNWQKILAEQTPLRSLIDFLYYLVSMKFVEKIPNLKYFLDLEKGTHYEAET